MRFPLALRVLSSSLSRPAPYSLLPSSLSPFSPPSRSVPSLLLTLPPRMSRAMVAGRCASVGLRFSCLKNIYEVFLIRTPRCTQRGLSSGPLAPDFSPGNTTEYFRHSEATLHKSVLHQYTARCGARKRETGCRSDPHCDFGIPAMNAGSCCQSHRTIPAPAEPSRHSRAPWSPSPHLARGKREQKENKRKGIFCLAQPASYSSTPSPLPIARESGVVTFGGEGALMPAPLVMGETIPALALHSAHPTPRSLSICTHLCERRFLVADLLRPFRCGAYPPVWWGMLWFVVAQPNIFLRIAGRRAAVLRWSFPTTQTLPRCRTWGRRFLGIKLTPPLFPSLLPVRGCSIGRAMGRRCRLYHGLFIRPPTDLVVVICCLPGADRRCELCRLVVVNSFLLREEESGKEGTEGR